MRNYLTLLLFSIVCLLLISCTNQPIKDTENHIMETSISSEMADNPNKELDFSESDLKTIYFAGGCFWGVEAFFEGITGVYDATSGYANGSGEDPTYSDVIKGDQGFAETVEVTYDETKVSLEELMDYFFMVIDPTMVNQQGNDIGIQYRTGIYYVDEADEPTIQKRMEQEQNNYDTDLATEIAPLENYYLAENEHQDYLDKNPNGYCHIDLGILDDINE